MWNNLLDYWKSFSFLGAISLPLLGVFFLGTKLINWSSPYGYYTRLKLFIKTSNSTRSVDLVAEYPTTNLDKVSHWKYCLPKNSQLKKESTVTTTNSTSSEEDCQLDWSRSSNSDLVNYLLKLGVKFLKLRHQINLLLIYSFYDKVSEDNYLRDEMIKKCGLKGKNNQEYLKDFFISETPISKNCLLVPEEVTLNLTVGEGTQQQASSQQTEIKLEELQKGKVSGNIRYSLSDWWGKLHEFSESGNNGNGTKSSILIKVLSKPFDLELENPPSQGANGKLNFDDLFKKYERKELNMCDFCKDCQYSGGAEQACKSVAK
ncbi:hypothetical protein OVS_03105 [Mycoplasma ovis str. Michigan]|uniref:Uncharacterized protein n=1 Tax=Mycoplasma ovis str. Michigan TaxID=1415773 RepID=A0ABN4BLT0_9MOLU|nr:hypothetical protein [Mycoplasma ovis]AHC40380.1 hypothetical protein OVS_03105 [Mycoplasma ovis str. Michigan]